MDIMADAEVYLESDEDYIIDGELIVRSGAVLVGTSNTVFLTGEDAGYTFNGAGEVYLQARTDSPGTAHAEAGVVIMQDRTSNVGGDSTINGGGKMDLVGTVYLPTQTMNIVGNAVVGVGADNFTIIADKVQIGGTSQVTAQGSDGSTAVNSTLAIARGNVILIK